MAQAVSRRSLATRPGSVHVQLVMDKVALGQVFLRVIGFPYQYHSTHITHGGEQ
jgi:hypothetical protein